MIPRTIKIIFFLILSQIFCFGQTELVQNGEFTTSLANWTQVGNVIFSNHYNNGNAAFSVDETVVNGVISQNIAATAGQTLTVTLNYARRGNGGRVAGEFDIIDNTNSNIISSTRLIAINENQFISTTFTITAPSNSLLIRFSDKTASTGSRDFHLNTVSITQPIPLPINLINFSALLTNSNYVLLNWKTATEINNEYFTIQRSFNGLIWEEIEFIKSEGNSYQVKSYSAMDRNPLKGLSYYRLKQTDLDGKYAFSSIRSINFKSDAIKVFPNPTLNKITIKQNENELTEVKIFNSVGVEVTHLTSQLPTNRLEIKMDLSNLEKGIYYLKTRNSIKKVYKK